jgi:hypothetical protein
MHFFKIVLPRTGLGYSFALTLVSFLVAAATTQVTYGASSPWLAGYRYRIAATIENKSMTAQPAMPVVLRWDALAQIGVNKLRVDAADLRVTDAEGHEVPRSIEGLDDDSDPARIWIRAASLPAGGKAVYYIFYDNPQAAPVENAHDAVFFPAHTLGPDNKLHLGFDDASFESLKVPKAVSFTLPESAPGYYGKSAWFNGQNAGALVKIPNPEELSSGFTVSFWIKRITRVTWGLQYIADLDATLQILDGKVILAGQEGRTTATYQMPFRQWNHLAVTYDGANLIVFVNGVEAGRQPVQGAVKFPRGDLALGYDPLTGGRFFTCMEIDDLTVTARPVVSFPEVHEQPEVTLGKPDINASVSAAPEPAERKVYLAVEAEDFDGVMRDKSYQSFSIGGKAQWFLCYPRDFLSRSLGIYTLSEGATASATVQVPHAGAYRLWVRYAPVGEQEYNSGFHTGSAFQLQVEQGGRTIATHEFGEAIERDERQVRWESMPVELRAGTTRLMLLKNIAKSNAGEKIDLVVLTTDQNYVPDQRHFSTVWLRWKILDLQGAGPYRGTVKVLRHDGHPWYNIFYLDNASYNLETGFTSDWIDATPYVQNAGSNVTFWLGLTDKQGQTQQGARVQVDFARRPLEAGIYKSVVSKSTRGFGATVPGTRAPLGDFEKISESVETLARQHLDRALAQKWPRPTTPAGIVLSAYAGVARYSDQVMRDELKTLRLMGFNQATTSYDAWGGKEQDLLAREAGFTQTSMPWQLSIGPQLTKESPYGEKFWQLLQQNLDSRIRALRQRSGEAELQQIQLSALNDEVGYWAPPQRFFAPDQQETLDAFRAWLTQQKVAPAFLGIHSWGELKPIFTREEATTPELKRLWMLEREFMTVGTAMIYRRATQMLEKAVGHPVWTTINPSPHQYMRKGFEMNYFDFWAKRGVTLPWSEDWSSSIGWLFISNEVTSYIADLLRCGARPTAAPTGMYLTPGSPEAYRQKVYSALAHGVRQLNYYIYGPGYAMTEGMWSEAPMFDEVGRINHEIAQADDLLAPARARKAPVALLYSFSQDVWQRDSSASAERFYLYLALVHAQVPVDIVSEEQVASGGLQGYRVLYVADENIRRDATQAIAKWVNAGGTLVALAGAGLRDEYGADSNSFDQLLGLAGRTVTRDADSVKVGFQRGGLPRLKELAQIDLKLPFPQMKLSVYGVTARLEVKAAQAIGSFADGSVAATINRSGRGRAICIGAFPGISYAKGSNMSARDYTTSYPDAERNLIVAPVKLAKVQSDVELSVPMVEATLQESVKGAVVTLVNYTMKDIPEVKITIHTHKPVKRVVSVNRNENISFAQVADGIRLKLPLQLTDFIKLYY